MSVTFEDVTFEGYSEHRIPAWCKKCGPTEVGVPNFGNRIHQVIGSTSTCLKCGGKAGILRANYSFVEKVAEAFQTTPPSKKQVKRFQRSVDKARGDLEAIQIKASTIGSAFEEVANLAKKEKDPWKAFKIAAAVAVCVFGGADSLATIVSGVESALNLYDRFYSPPSHENDSSQPSNDQPESDNNANTPTEKMPDGTYRRHPTKDSDSRFTIIDV